MALFGWRRHTICPTGCQNAYYMINSLNLISKMGLWYSGITSVSHVIYEITEGPGFNSQLLQAALLRNFLFDLCCEHFLLS